MPSDTSRNQMSDQEKRAKRAQKKSLSFDIEELEKRVLLAELRAREAEAEIRYMEAAAKRKAMKAGKKDKNKNRAASHDDDGSD